LLRVATGAPTPAPKLEGGDKKKAAKPAVAKEAKATAAPKIGLPPNPPIFAPTYTTPGKQL